MGLVVKEVVAVEVVVVLEEEVVVEVLIEVG